VFVHVKLGVVDVLSVRGWSIFVAKAVEWVGGMRENLNE
jgi:hypothetical protein